MTEELSDLKRQANNLVSITLNASEINNHLENYQKIISHLQTTIQGKLNSINLFYTPNDLTHNNNLIRHRRSFIPELGSLMKMVTGNLDEKDGQRYEEILLDIRTNAANLQRQQDLQYTISTTAIQRSDETLKKIDHNEQALKSRINQLSEIVRLGYASADPVNIMIAGETYSQLISLYTTILTVIQDIENSVTFCRSKTFHPNILNPKELLLELEKLNKIFPGQIPVEVNNLSELQRFIEVNCKIDATQNYLLSFFSN